ncbi:MAG: sulfotransferase domain-containing protein [Pseudomonadota bacterium]
MKIRRWGQFEKNIRLAGRELLSELDRYPGSVLVAGCQRSGTTVATEVVNSSGVFGSHAITQDTELDAALILSGHTSVAEGRYCFQTTYLNERFIEYFQHANFQLIWVLRQPVPVVRSMLFNWSRFSLNRLYAGVGAEHLDKVGGAEKRFWNDQYVSRLKKACASYIGKISQTQQLYDGLPGDQILVVDYDDLTGMQKDATTRRIFEFLNLDFNASHSKIFTGSTMTRKKDPLSSDEVDFVEDACRPTYLAARSCLM